MGADLVLAALAGLDAPDAMLDLLLAPLAPDLYDYLRHHRGQSTADVVAALRVLAVRVLAAEAGSITG